MLRCQKDTERERESKPKQQTPTSAGGGVEMRENDKLLLFIESGGRDKRCHIFAQIHNRVMFEFM